MRNVTCSKCQNTAIPLNHSIKIDQAAYCGSCAEATFTEDEMKGKLVEREFDPTVCSMCSADFGQTELPKIAQYPTCAACTRAVHEKTFPLWVKAFFIGILIIVVFSFIFNWRFLEGYRHVQAAKKALIDNDVDALALHFSAAAKSVPEEKQLQGQADYYTGIVHLRQGDGAAALSEFEAAKDFVPNDFEVSYLILQAKASSAYDAHNYDQFLQTSNAILQYDSTERISWGRVASAYSCLYLTHNKSDSLKRLYDAYRTRAMAFPDSTREMARYMNRLDYRMATGAMLTQEEFDSKFPNGWVNP